MGEQLPEQRVAVSGSGGDTRRTTKNSDLYIKPRSVDFDWVRQVTSIVHLSERLRGPLVNIARLGKVSRLLSTSNTLQLVTICRYLQYILDLQALTPKPLTLNP